MKFKTILWALLSRDCCNKHQGNKSNELFSNDIKKHESISYALLKIIFGKCLAETSAASKWFELSNTTLIHMWTHTKL